MGGRGTCVLPRKNDATGGADRPATERDPVGGRYKFSRVLGQSLTTGFRANEQVVKTAFTRNVHARTHKHTYTRTHTHSQHHTTLYTMRTHCCALVVVLFFFCCLSIAQTAAPGSGQGYPIPFFTKLLLFYSVRSGN